MSPRLIIATTSKNRLELLKLAGISHIATHSNFDEQSIAPTAPQKYVSQIARGKVEAVIPKYAHKSVVIVGADTVGVFQGKILTKPKFKTHAYNRLLELSGKPHTMLTGWAIYQTKTQQWYTGVSETTAYFRNLEKEEVLSYVNDHPVTSWAAGYSPLNTPAVSFIHKIEGSLTGFSHGLPLEAIVPVLTSLGAI